MGNEIPLQLTQFLRSILLGSTLALFYDLTRALRILGGRTLEILLDALVGITSVSSVFLFIMAEDGELRLFILFGVLGGAIFFFSLLSAPMRPIWSFWVDLALLPIHLFDAFAKKLLVFSKKVFSFFSKWLTIMGTPMRIIKRKEHAHGNQPLQTENASQQ